MKLKVDRIISIATLAAALVAIILVLKKPAPVATQQAPSAAVERAQPNEEMAAPGQQVTATPVQREQQSSSNVAYTATVPAPPVAVPQTAATPAQSNAKPDAGVNSDQISAVVTKMLGAGGSTALTPDSNVGSGEPVIKDQQVTMEGDIVHGRFLTEIAGKDVWVTISGHMGEKDGYATFDPTEFKVGDMEVPVSLVNPALQRKLAEQRDRLKIPANGSQ